jgi:hypothetical protein
MRGELFTTRVNLENRAYFFNVKENRNGDVFLQIVESKSKEGSEAERRDVVLFADDMSDILKGLDQALQFIDRDRKDRARKAREVHSAKAKEARDLQSRLSKAPPKIAAGDEGPKKTGRVHVVSKIG